MRIKPIDWLPLLLVAGLLLGACGGGPAYTDEQVAAGAQLYAGTCSACHGPDATGVTGLGKNLTTSTFVAEQSDEALKAMIAGGRPSSDPLNSTGIDMPPKGGNPALSDADLLSIIAYLRSIHK